MIRPVLVAWLIASAVLAQPTSAPETDGPAAAARALLAADDSSAAYDAVRRALRDAPADPALNHLRLRLELAGHYVGRLPRPMKHQQLVDVANRLRRAAPDDTLALRVLTEDAVWTVLDWHDRVDFVDVASPVGNFVDPVEVSKRLGQSRFDMDQRAAMGDMLDRSQRAQDARRDAAVLLEDWVAADPTAAQAYAAAATLAAVDEDWDALLGVAERFRDATGDPRADLYAGLAHHRLGDLDAAGDAFERALPRLPPTTRARYEDARLLVATEQRDAYDADPEAGAAALWAEADPRLLTERSERQVEHRARVAEADLLFGRNEGDLFVRPPGPGADTEQGQLWVRYGRPPAALSFVVGDFDPSAYGDGTFRVWAYEDDLQFVFDDPELDGVFRRYSPPASAFSGSGTSAINDDFVMRDQALQRTDPERSQLTPTVDVPALASRFRASGGGTDVIVAWGVPVDSVAAPVRTGAFARVEGAVVDRVVRDHASLTAGRVVRAGGGAVWVDAAQVRLSGPGDVRVEVEGDGGEDWGAASETIGPLGAGFGVSDLLLATSVDEDGRGPVVRGGLGLVPSPRAAFPTTDPVYVVLEAYGLGLEDGRTRYTIEATLRPEARRGGLLGFLFGRGQGPGVSVRTEASGSRPDDLVSFFVDIRDQDPGAYTLTVTVADETTGASASAERRVTLE
ncbi:hypothetical protein [Rubrivirga marina]|uniref:GWxTD domain-containing protein n=1 Tax=Rubrivirga marina TaxID=1196024 RepID=A0A271IVF1_9BACT|nr:hypothetical protein [Rubrivirga marina]PAP75203.1 hypothetical protein BSZ37_01465 [Rubrivirga marina]